MPIFKKCTNNYGPTAKYILPRNGGDIKGISKTGNKKVGKIIKAVNIIIEQAAEP